MICTHPGENATCVQEGAAAAAAAAQAPVNKTQPVKLTCEQCFTKFLTNIQITTLVVGLARSLGVDIHNLTELCAILPEQVVEARLQATLASLTDSPELAAQIIQCLKDAGVQFLPG